jgi:hypothetical protein
MNTIYLNIFEHLMFLLIVQWSIFKNTSSRAMATLVHWLLNIVGKEMMFHMHVSTRNFFEDSLKQNHHCSQAVVLHVC